MSPYDLYEASPEDSERVIQLLVRDGLSAILSMDGASHEDLELFVRAAAILWDRGVRDAYDAMAREWGRTGRASAEFACGMMLPSRPALRDQIGFWAKADEMLLEATHDPSDPFLVAVRSGGAHSVVTSLGSDGAGPAASRSTASRFASCRT